MSAPSDLCARVCWDVTSPILAPVSPENRNTILRRLTRLARRRFHRSSLFLCVCIFCLCAFVLLTFLFVRIHCPPQQRLFLILLHSIASLSDLGALLPRSISPGFCSLLFLPLPTLSSFTNKGQVGIKVDTHLNKEWPTKHQIYALSAVCNCTYPEVCPPLLFVYSS